RTSYRAWTRDLSTLESDARNARRGGTPLSQSELQRRNRTLLNRYSTGRENDFSTYEAQAT
ncbi:MAG TPA: hypothetical protein VLE27_10405, partial [Thermoanaerobaculia bacterium]|nr:hypothetical protein [Thermoanaerobaculia bacterium]